jgi:hypothetical protein
MCLLFSSYANSMLYSFWVDPTVTIETDNPGSELISLGCFGAIGERRLMSKQAAEHHHKAAEHHEHAARHHKEAAKHHEAGKHETAAHHAHLAHGHHVHATHHAGEAAKAHIEHHGKASPAHA